MHGKLKEMYILLLLVRVFCICHVDSIVILIILFRSSISLVIFSQVILLLVEKRVLKP